jgi:hypothetical protein
MFVVRFDVRTVNPIDNVKSSIGAHKEYIVPRQVLHLTVTLQDNELWQDCHALQVNGKGPKQLENVNFAATSNKVCNERNDGTRSHGKLPMQKGILGLVIGSADWLLKLNHVDNGGGGSNVQYLHAGIVQGIIRGKKIQISSDKDQKEEFLRSNGNSYE